MKCRIRGGLPPNSVRIAETLFGIVEDDFERGFYDNADHRQAVATLKTARLLTGKPDLRRAIEALLDSIEAKYGRLD